MFLVFVTVPLFGCHQRSVRDNDRLYYFHLLERLFPSRTEIYLELGGIHMQGCRCCERLKTKSSGGENLTLPRWIGDVLKITLKLLDFMKKNLV